MNANLTDITVILDRSGSMSSVQSDTIGGFNTFLEAQQALPGECSLSLVQFDSEYEPVYVKPIKDAPKLNPLTFVPRGSTALLDAIGRTIVAAGVRFAAMKQEDRPGKVMFVILTDGEENASVEYRREKIMDMIKEQTDVYKWDFVFLGANQDAIQAGASIGIGAGKSMSFASNAVGTRAVFTAASNYMASARNDAVALASNAFTQEDRDEQAKAGVQ